ncbi:hypothetical protein [Corynebacterium sp.]|uniref:hypothetical protein n=1 Tax=Corynebacterium sp. TaxID=1720 RepID=UPI0028ADB29F|nr:hypothetical protein [Corynebacterium sp.]
MFSRKLLQPPKVEIAVIILAVIMFMIPGSSLLIGKIIHPVSIFLLVGFIPALILSVFYEKLTERSSQLLTLGGAALIVIYIFFRFASDIYYAASLIVLLGGPLLTFGTLSWIRIRASVRSASPEA